jgi:RNA polymerase-binding transcription factor DksA
MNPLTPEQRNRLAQRLRERKALLLDEIRGGLAGSGRERYVDLLGAGGDAGDESVASLLRDIAEAEIVRDVGEVRDIVAAEQRLASGRYGLCIDCGKPIRYARLDAYPSAKRCLACQEHREKTRAPSPYTGR